MKIDLRARPFYLDDEAAAWVEHTRDAMTVEDKVGQLFCVLFKQAVPSELEYVLGILKPGGCMYRVVSAERAVSFTQALQGALNIPPLIAANLEKGGNGIVEEGTLLGSPMEVAATDSVDMAVKLAEVCGKEGRAVGANWAFAPIIDIDANFRSPITNTRTFGNDPVRVREMGAAYTRKIQELGRHPLSIFPETDRTNGISTWLPPLTPWTARPGWKPTARPIGPALRLTLSPAWWGILCSQPGAGGWIPGWRTGISCQPACQKN